MDPFARTEVRRSTYLFYLSASTVAVLIALGYVMSTPTVKEWLVNLEAHALGRALVGCVLVFAAIACFALWATAVWYAAVSPDVILPRSVVISLLIVSNVAGSFFYYWLSVHWRSGTRRVRQLPHPLTRAQPSN